MERMLGGLETAPIEPHELSKTLQKWYGMLRENGMMFIQVPVVFNRLLSQWKKMLENEYPGVFEIQAEAGTGDAQPSGVASFRLRKLTGAPDKLPLLDIETVKSTPKWQTIIGYD